MTLMKKKTIILLAISCSILLGVTIVALNHLLFKKAPTPLEDRVESIKLLHEKIDSATMATQAKLDALAIRFGELDSLLSEDLTTLDDALKSIKSGNQQNRNSINELRLELTKETRTWERLHGRAKEFEPINIEK